MAEIKAIDGKSVHQICSGQVILDLSIALKELVENSLDAGATSIEVKLKENGLESVEVSDNGRGVEEKNFAALTLKHHTSKLKDFTDLESVETFGFRGEALSSLCALCDVTICTRHANSSVGHRLEYDHDGKVTSQATVARPPGTTVTLKNLFKTLPVRFKELKKNIKKEYSRLLTLLNAYCIISTDVKITCSNQSGKSRHGIIVATQLESSMDRNVAAVFGSKQLHSLIPFRQLTPSDEVCEDYNLNREEALRTSQMYTIRGLISDPIHGNGRSVPDRQFYYINSRPVELPRLARLINEVYHIHNRHQFPFVVLDVITSRDKVDINVTPDKRQVFVHNEKVLLSVVKTSLMEMYEQRGGNVVASIGKPPLQDFFQSSTQSRDASELHPTDITEEKEGPKSPDSVSLKSVNSTPKTVNSTPKTRLDGKPSPLSLHNLAQYRSPACPSKATESCHKRRSCAQLLGATVAKQPRMDAFVSRAINNDSEPIRLNDDEPNCVENVQIIISTSDDETLTVEVSSRDDLNQSQDVPPDYPSSPLPSIEVDGPEFDSPRKHTHQSQVVQVSMERLKRWSEMTGGRESTTYDNISSFHAQIDPRQNTSAEKELTRHLSKESFLDMRPLGQFNLGFVIARLGNDLFIIDQHASDEIYNFETLQRSTEIHSLKLVVPQRLQLDPAAHSVLTDNMSVFRKNGFDFDVKPEPESGKEIIHMTRVPVSKNWDFGSHDVDELIFMLSDAPHVMCRPSRIRQMFASRACRKSIMIGTALTCREMSRLVKHMSEINHPWNCPHGRPTMRHLIDLSKIT